MVAAAAPPRLTDDSWRLPGCGERCRIFWVSAVGRAYPEQMASHDPFHHEAFGTNILAREYAVLYGRAIQTGELYLDGPSVAATVSGQHLHLTPREASILFYLAANIGRLCFQGEILRAVWGPEFAPGVPRGAVSTAAEPDAHLLWVNMARLRGKLGTAKRLIETNPGRGYRLLQEPPLDLGVA